MGLIRKTLMVSTGGLVRGSSKKQRVAKASLNQLKQQTRIMKEQERVTSQEQRLDEDMARMRAMGGSAKRMLNPGGTHEERKAALGQIRSAYSAIMATGQPQPAAIAPAPVAPTLPLAGWYADPDREHLMRWWDGSDWTARTAPRA